MLGRLPAVYPRYVIFDGLEAPCEPLGAEAAAEAIMLLEPVDRLDGLLTRMLDLVWREQPVSGEKFD